MSRYARREIPMYLRGIVYLWFRYIFNVFTLSLLWGAKVKKMI